MYYNTRIKNSVWGVSMNIFDDDFMDSDYDIFMFDESFTNS